MTQNEYDKWYRELNEAQKEATDEFFAWKEKASKGKDCYADIGITRINGKAEVALRDGDGWSPYGAVAYGGSALFIDGVGENGKMNSGYGDIKISGKDMTKLLSYLDSDYNPTITIRAAQ